jgi:spoIIIJ-associated protein
MDQPTTDETIEIEAASFPEAIAAACSRLGLSAGELAIDLVDPGSSESSSLGFRPVKVKVRRRDPQAAPDGAGRAPARGNRYAGSGHSRGSRDMSHRAGPRDSGPPPAPLDPELVTPEMVAMVGDLTRGLVGAMEFEGATVEASKTKHGIRVGVNAGEFDEHLIGPDGETLGALQHLVTRMIRSRMPQSASPRLEIDVAGYRDRQIEALRQIARDLMSEVADGAPEAATDPLPASERRIVHLEVAESPEFETVTVGDGFYKRVIIRRATPKE